jgi:hypothetical protein
MRQAVIALCVLSSLLLLFFAWMARTRQLTFAILAAKHGWDLQEKAAAMHKAAVAYGALALVLAFWHLVVAIIYKSAFGVAARRVGMQCLQRLARVFASKDTQRSLAGKNSDVSDDDTRDRQSELRSLTSPRARSSGGGRAWRGFGTGGLSSSDDVEMSNPPATNALHIGLTAGGIDPFGFPAPAPPPLPPAPTTGSSASSAALNAILGGGGARFAATSLSSAAAGTERRATPSGGGSGQAGAGAGGPIHHTRSGSAGGGGTAGLQPRVTGILAPLAASPGNSSSASAAASAGSGGGVGSSSRTTPPPPGGAASAAARMPPPKVDLDTLLSSTGVR